MAQLDASAAERFRITVELAETGRAIQRENLRRRHPTVSESEVDALLQAWLDDRPPDAPGRVTTFDR